MSDRPILFSAPMIRALRDGRKTQTRRLLTPRTSPFCAGDLLWVREAWRTYASFDEWAPAKIGFSSHDAGWGRPWMPVRFDADTAEVNHVDADAEWGRSRASIHLPRWASRLTLLVTDVRVQTLHEISETDARAEGVAPGLFDGPPGWEECAQHLYVPPFRDLWERLHGPGAWASNPLVRAITFTMRPVNIDDAVLS